MKKRGIGDGFTFFWNEAIQKESQRANLGLSYRSDVSVWDGLVPSCKVRPVDRGERQLFLPYLPADIAETLGGKEGSGPAAYPAYGTYAFGALLAQGTEGTKEEPAGTCVFSIVKEDDEPGERCAVMRWICTDEALRGRGIGRTLLTRAAERLAMDGIRMMRAWLLPDKAYGGAAAFLSRMGFAMMLMTGDRFIGEAGPFCAQAKAALSIKRKYPQIIERHDIRLIPAEDPRGVKRALQRLLRQDNHPEQDRLMALREDWFDAAVSHIVYRDGNPTYMALWHRCPSGRMVLEYFGPLAAGFQEENVALLMEGLSAIAASYGGQTTVEIPMYGYDAMLPVGELFEDKWLPVVIRAGRTWGI